MGKKNQERRVYTRELKAGAAAMARKLEKPIARVTGDLGVGGAVSRRWIQRARGEEATRLRKEVKALGSAA
jgi:transposase-like protein